MEQWIFVVGVLALATGVLVGLAWLYPRLKREEQGYPYEENLEALLLPVIYQGICAAYRISEQAMDEIGTRLRGLDKRRIADAVYDMMPDEINGRSIKFVKEWLPRERFAELVQEAFNRFDSFYEDRQRQFGELFDEWRRAQEDSPVRIWDEDD